MPTQGPIPSEIAIIADYPDSYGTGFGYVGSVLSRLGITATSCFFTTLSETRPPDDDVDNWLSTRKTCPGAGWAFSEGLWIHPTLVAAKTRLLPQLTEVAPKLVITLGKAPLALVTGQSAIAKWQGSRLTPPGYPFTLVPIQHPRILSKQPDQDFILKLCLQRAYNIYVHKQLPRDYSFLIQPTYHEVVNRLLGLLAQADAGPLRLSGDLETRAGNIACFGIAWSATEALCIPYLVIHPDNPFYWTIDEESDIIALIAQLFHHPNILWIGQNFSYDCQHFYRHWGILPVKVRDTMVGHHSLHSNIRKGLDFLSLLYAQDHVYWKDEIKEWDPKIGEKQYWTYNCKDACVTYETDEQIVEEARTRK